MFRKTCGSASNQGVWRQSFLRRPLCPPLHFFTIYGECQNRLSTKNILECHDQRAAVGETELLIKLLHSKHQNSALPLSSRCVQTQAWITEKKSLCNCCVATIHSIWTPDRFLRRRETRQFAVCLWIREIHSFSETKGSKPKLCSHWA